MNNKLMEYHVCFYLKDTVITIDNIILANNKNEAEEKFKSLCESKGIKLGKRSFVDFIG